MMRSLDKLLRWIGLALIPVAVILFVKQYTLLHTGLEYAVTSTVGAVVGMIPEGLYLLTSLALAVGVLNLARRRTLVHELSCIETWPGWTCSAWTRPAPSPRAAWRC